jgi:hypothetical protein
MPEEPDNAATKRDLHDLELALVDRMQRLERQQLALAESLSRLRENVSKLRNSMWLSIVVPSLTLLVSLVIHYLFR